MTKTTKSARDAFTFSLGGLTSVGSFVFVPAIEDDRVRMDRPARRDSEQQRPDGLLLPGWDFWPESDYDRAA